MNPVERVVQGLQDLLAHVPELVQPLVVALAGAVPFVEGEGGALLGVLGGLHPVLAAVAAATGNFLCVLAVVSLGSGVRARVTARRAAADAEAAASTGAAFAGSGAPGGSGTATAVAPTRPESKGRQRLRRYLVRFGVPGASLLGPLALPTQLTAATLVASGVRKGWVLLWQAVAIVLWTTLATVSAWAALHVVLPAA
ncbi:small multidrug efflux protein [Cellulomonas sp. PS-H5]|uniref:small multidrug efflux protein n=1 Tax=Cellulomonas sp. PS-H5 TaxID=2820400 RepID=UPI001C4FA40B|nr:small multidrug efflux protein [Cellulomonas sp. PS-H5]MBW0255946.1 small multidrug efflux protein [Cellulomonas sp. PS-H5]